MTHDHTDVVVDLVLPHDYTIRVELDRPGGAQPLARLSPPGRRPGRDGLCIEIRSASGQALHWLLEFGKPDAERYVSAVVSTPSPQVACVVSRGAAYMIDSIDPSRSKALDAYGVTGWLCESGSNVLILVTDYTLVSIAKHGVAWTASNDTWAGFRHLSLHGGLLTGEVWSPARDRWFPLSVDARTGAYVYLGSPLG